MFFLKISAIIVNLLTAVFVIWWMFYKTNKKFISSDPQPNIQPYSNLLITDNIKIRTGVVIKSIPEIDIEKNFLTINCIVWFKFNPSIVSIESIETFSFLNCTSIEKELIYSSIENGESNLEYRVQLSISSIFDHRYFPINDHIISLLLVNEGLTTQEVIFDVSNSAAQFEKSLRVGDMEMIAIKATSGYRSKNFQLSNDSNNANFPAVLYTIYLKNNGLRNMLLIFIPLILISWISSISDLLEAMFLKHNFTFAVNSLTLILAYRYVIMQISPKVNYTTLAENIYHLSLFYVFINFFLMLTMDIIKNDTLTTLLLFNWYLISKPLYFSFFIYFLYFKKDNNKPKQQSHHIFKKKLLSFNLNNIHINNYKYFLSHSSKWYYFNFKNKYLNFIKLARKAVENPFPGVIHKFKRCFIVSQWGKNHENMDIYLRDLIKNKVLNDNLTLHHPDDYLIFNQTHIQNLESWIDFMTLQLILFLKNPNQVLFLQDSRCVNKTFEEQHLLLNLDSDFQSLYDDILENIQNIQTKLASYIIIKNEFENIRIQTDEQSKTNEPYKSLITDINTSKYAYATNNLFYTQDEKGILHWHMEAEIENRFNYAIIHDAHPHYFEFVNPGGHSVWYSLFYLTYPEQISKTNSSPKELIFYSSMDFNKTSTVISKNVIRGLSSYISKINHDLLTQKKVIKIYTLNDDYEPLKTYQNIQFFIKKHSKPPTILCPIGTPTLESFEQELLHNKLTVLFPFSGGSLLRQSQYKSIYFFRESFIHEALMLVNHAINQKNSKKLCIFFQNDSYGNGAVQGILPFLKSSKIDYLLLPYERNNPNVSSLINKINEFETDSILFISTFSPASQLAHALGTLKLSELNLYAISYAANNFYDYLKTLGIQLIRTHLVPPLNASIEIVKDYHYYTNKVLLPFPPTDESLEAFIVANIIEEMLKTIEYSLKQNDIERYFNSIKNISFKGIELNFNPDTRELYHQIWIED